MNTRRSTRRSTRVQDSDLPVDDDIVEDTNQVGVPEPNAPDNVEDTNRMEIDLTNDASPEGRLKSTSCGFSQTTPGLLKNGPPILNEELKSSKPDAESDDDDQSCPVCFDTWTNSGPHRLSSLNCGHLFGRSCIERWLKDPKNKCCPQCKSKARRSDIRNIYAKSLKAYDTTERDQAKKELVEEKYKRSKAEEGEAKVLLQFQLLKQEMEQLKRQVESQQQQTATSTSSANNRQPLATARPTTFMSSQANSQSMQPSVSIHQNKITKSYGFQRSLQISQKEARVMAYEPTNMIMVVSKPSPNQLFPGFGILKVSSLQSRSSEYIRIHQKPIRDAKFNKSGDNLILTASIDKTLKLTSVLSNNTVQSYTCPGPVWSCAWNETDKNYVYAGLQNGSCLVYDIRKTDSYLHSIKPRVGVPCPIVSLSYVQPAADRNDPLRCEGILVGTLQGGWFIQKGEDTYSDHQLLFPEGSCSGLYFEQKTRHCLLSQRPGKKCSRNLHSICRLSGDATEENPVQVKVVKQCFGGNRAQSLTRSTLFTCPDDDTRLMLCSGDESSSSTIVWDGSRGEEIQKLSSSGGTIFDVMTFSAYESQHFLATLTEQKLSFYQWQ